MRKISKKKLNSLAKKALKNGHDSVPQPGFNYLKNIPVGSLFYTESNMKGILLECDTNAKVIILDVKVFDERDKQYYLGKQIIGAETEVTTT